MLKTLNMVLVRCSVAFPEMIIDIFKMKNLELTPKIPKCSNFKIVYAIFSIDSMNFVDWNVEKSQQGKNLLSSRLFRRVYSVF